MPESRRKFDPEFRDGAVRLVLDTGKSVAEVARDLGINPGILVNWVVTRTCCGGTSPLRRRTVNGVGT